MNCKHCQAELPEETYVCPECGTDNQPEDWYCAETVELSEADRVLHQQPAEQKSAAAVKATPVLIGIGITIIVLLAAILVALIVNGVNGWPASDAAAGTTPTETLPPLTTPADSGLNDETFRGSYSAGDETVLAAKDTVVATYGDAKLTNADLQVIYWTEVSSFYSQLYYYSSMGYDMSYLGFDITRPFEGQMCALSETPVTWQQFFLGSAIDKWVKYTALKEEANAAGFQVAPETQEFLDGYEEGFAVEALNAGFESAEEYLYENLGAGADLEDYLAYLNLVYPAGEYLDQVQADFAPTDAEIEAYHTERTEEYAAQGISKDDYSVDVRHILIMPEGATSATIRTETFPQEAWDAAMVQAEAIKTMWEEGEMTEESFGLLANEHSQDANGEVTNGGIYEGVLPGQMITEFNDWCFDPDREVGDCEIVTTMFGHHIMYFSGKTSRWPEHMETIKADMATEFAQNLLDEAVAKRELTVDYAAIELGVAGLFASEEYDALIGDDSFLWWIPAVAAVVVLAVAAVVVLIVVKKRKGHPVQTAETEDNAEIQETEEDTEVQETEE